jgi:uncharacterized membrane protein YkvA (DUF1232 family)
MNATEAGKRLLKHGADAVTMLRALRRDARVPSKVKWVLGAALASVVSPIDLIPDFIPVLGQLDDAFVLASALRYAAKNIPPDALYEAWPGDPGVLDAVLKTLGVHR